MGTQTNDLGAPISPASLSLHMQYVSGERGSHMFVDVHGRSKKYVRSMAHISGFTSTVASVERKG
jgi:hypothetical protein